VSNKKDMLIHVFRAKLHRVVVTEADLNYMGSITIDENLLDASGIIPNEKVQVVNVNNGERFETYVIKGERGPDKFASTDRQPEKYKWATNLS